MKGKVVIGGNTVEVRIYKDIFCLFSDVLRKGWGYGKFTYFASTLYTGFGETPQFVLNAQQVTLHSPLKPA
jgi:hypothetical protein